MTTEAMIGSGSAFAKGDGASPEVFTAFAEVLSIGGPSLARDAVDATHMASPNGWREFIPGLKDAGEVSIELQFVPANTTLDVIRAQFDTDTVSNWRITWPDSPASVFTFPAICTGFNPEASVDGKLTATVTFKVTGEPTFA